MPVSTLESPYRPLDERGNLVVQDGSLDATSVVRFDGRHNRLVIDGSVAPSRVNIHFLGDDAQVVVGAINAEALLGLDLQVAAGSRIEIGPGVSSEEPLSITTAPGASVHIGSGSHFGSGTTITAEDRFGFGAGSGEHRHDVTVGAHVWIVQDTELRGGTEIGDGAVLELVPLVDDAVPAAQLVRGLPATAVRPVTWDRAEVLAAR